MIGIVDAGTATSAMMARASAYRILIVDDDQMLRDGLEHSLRPFSNSVWAVGGMQEAIRIARTEPLSHAVLDLHMEPHGGLEVLQVLLKIRPELQAIVLTGYASIASAVEAVRLGAVGYVEKPADAAKLLDAFYKAEQPPLTALDTDRRPRSLSQVMWDHMDRVLVESGGNISEAARRLGMHRRSLQRKLGKRPD